MRSNALLRRLRVPYAEHPMAGVSECSYGWPMNPILKRLALLLLAAASLVLASTACQTTKGFGKDVEKLGDKIQDKAK